MNGSSMTPAAASMHTPSARSGCRERKPYRSRPIFLGEAKYDLANNMKEVPYIKSTYSGLGAGVIEKEVSSRVSHCTSCDMTTENCCCDTLMKELDQMGKDVSFTQTDASNSVFGSSAANSCNAPADAGFEKPPSPPFIGNSYTLFLGPETRPLTQEQLIQEAKGIYAGLVMVERKCIEVDQQQASKTNKLSNERWQALIALHRSLLSEHHDFYVATHHPLASPALRDLARKYGMTARMWEHGINGFLNLVLHRMPGMAEQMLAYLAFAYSILENLRVQVPSLAPEWTECINGLNMYCRELQRILQPRPTSWDPCTFCGSGWTGDGAMTSLSPDYMECQYQASTVPNRPRMCPTCCQNGRSGAPDGFDGLQSNFEVTPNMSSSTNPDQEVHRTTNGGVGDARTYRLPHGATLSQVASLVLAGWLYVGQGSSLDFNIFVQAFCILALSDLA